jgi:hypothetical protein
MSLFYSPLKRFYKFILKKILGQFLRNNELDLDQLDVELSSGVVELRDLQLNIDILNELSSDLPIILVSGFIKTLRITIPWRAILTENVKIQVDGLELIVIPAEQVEKKGNNSISNIMEQSIAALDKTELAEHVRLHRMLQQSLNNNGDPQAKQTSPHSKAAEVNNSSNDDAANEGLKVVASFLEQIVSQTELLINDVSLKITHQQKAGDKQTVLVIRLPWLAYSDMNKQQDSAKSSNSGSRSSPSPQPNSPELNSASSTSPARALGPKYEYHKAIRFHGFRVELYEELSQLAVDQSFDLFQQQNHPNNTVNNEDPVAQQELVRNLSSFSDSSANFGNSSLDSHNSHTIIHGDVDQDCIIQLKVKIADNITGPKVESNCFIRSLRGVLTPRQLALMLDVFNAIALSSKQIAAQAHNNLQQNSHSQHAQSKQPLDNSEAKLQDIPLSSSSSPHASATLNSNKHNNDGTSNSTNNAAVLNLWSMEVHIKHCALSLLEEDELPNPNWWLTPPVSSGPLHSDESLISSSINGLNTDHLLFTLDHVLINIQQTSQESIIQVTIGTVQLREYLKQIQIVQDSMPVYNQATKQPEYRQIPVFRGFKARSLLKFHVDHIVHSTSEAENSISGARFGQTMSAVPELSNFISSVQSILTPHFKLDFRSAVNRTFQPYPLSLLGLEELDYNSNGRVGLASRVLLEFQPLQIDFDLGIAERLHNITCALSESAAYLSLFLSFDSGNHAFTPPNQGKAHQFQGSPAKAADMLADIALNQTNKSKAPLHNENSHNLHHIINSNNTVDQIIISAHRIHLNIAFPADTPSQAKEKLEKESKAENSDETANNSSETIDTRGPLREERLLLELLDICVYNSSFTTGPHSPLQDALWNIRFNTANAYLLYNSGHNPDASQFELDHTVENLLTKQILTTHYATNYSIQENLNNAAAALIKVLVRAPSFSNNPSSAADTAAHSHGKTAEEMFFDSLPSLRWWEPAIIEDKQSKQSMPEKASQSTRPVPGANQQLNQQWLNPPNLHRDFSSGDSSTSDQFSDALLFETKAMNNAGILVTIQCPSCCFTMSKYEYELIMLLYNIYTEVSDPEVIRANGLAQEQAEKEQESQWKQAKLQQLKQQQSVSDNKLSESVQSLQPEVKSMNDSDMIEQKYQGNASADPSKSEIKPSQTISPARAKYSPNTIRSHILPSCPKSSIARSETPSSVESDSDSEMFESVVGADSVILKSNFPGQNKGAQSLAHSQLFSSYSDTSRFADSAADLTAQHNNLNATALSDIDSDLYGEESSSSEENTEIQRKSPDFGLKSILIKPSAAAAREIRSELAESHTSLSDSDAELTANFDPNTAFSQASLTSSQLQLFQPPAMQQHSSIHEKGAGASYFSNAIHQDIAPVSKNQPGNQLKDSLLQRSGTESGLFQSFLPQNSLLTSNGTHSTEAAENGEKIELPAYIPIAAQPLKLHKRSKQRNPENKRVAGVALPSPTAASTSFRHFLALKLIISQASLTLQENSVTAHNSTQRSAYNLKDSQTFHIDLGEFQLFCVVQFDNKPVSYISARAGDLTAREYNQIVTFRTELNTCPSVPIVFKTMSDNSAHSGPFSADSALSASMSGSVADSITETNSSSLLFHAENSANNASSVQQIDSTAWKNPVCIANVVVKLNPSLNLRENTAVINLRALTLQFRPESDWILKIMDFFLPYTAVEPPLPHKDSNSPPNEAIGSGGSAAAAANVDELKPVVGVAASAKDFIKFYLHCFDTSIDYNPAELAARAVLCVDHIALSTTIYPDSSQSIISIEGRDAALFLLPRCTKFSFSPTPNLIQFSAPFLHRITADSLFSYLESANYARVMALDYLETNLKIITFRPEESRKEPEMSVEITNGKLSLFTCWDSWQVFIELAQHFVNSITEIKKTAEIDIQFDDSTRAEENEPVGQEESNSAEEGSGSDIDSDVEEDNADTVVGLTNNRNADPISTAAKHSGADAELSVERNLLSGIDNNMFGPDLGVGSMSPGVEFIDNYQEEKKRATSISLALQAAAEREIARQKRERETQLASNNSTSYDSDPFNLYDFSNDSAGNNPSAPVAHIISDLLPQQNARIWSNDLHYSARWYSSREAEERAARDKQEAELLGLTEEERMSKVQLEKELEEQQERRRKRLEQKEKQGKASRSAKNQPIPPKVLDDHILLPEEKLIGASKGIQAAHSHKLQPPANFPTPEMLLILHDVTVCWRLFGGADWILPQQPVTAEQTNSSHSKDHASADVKMRNNNLSPNIASDSTNYHGDIIYSDSAARMNTINDYNPNEIEVHASPDPSTQHSALNNRPSISRESLSNNISNAINNSPDLTTIPLSNAALRYQNPFIHRSPTAAGVILHNDYVAEVTQSSPDESKFNHSPSIGDNYSVDRGQRETERVMEFHGVGANMRLDLYSKFEQVASRLCIAVDVIEIHDLMLSSSFKKFLCYYNKDNPLGRELHSSQLRLELTSVRPDLKRADREELRMRLSLLPLRLNIDQDAVEFFVDFFNHKAGSALSERQPTAENTDSAATGSPNNSSSSPLASSPDERKGRSYASGSTAGPAISTENGIQSSDQVVDETYIQLFQTTLPIKISIDYKPKRIDYRGLQGGDYSQLVNLFALEGVEIDLKRIKLTGIQGWDRVLLALGKAWGTDLARTQVHHYLAGVQPIRSLVNVGSGVADLVLLPIQQYRKNGRIAQGLTKGATSFVKSVTVETMSVAARLAQGTQNILETVDTILTPNYAEITNQRNAAARQTRNRRRRTASSTNNNNSLLSLTNPRVPTYSKMNTPPRGYKEGFLQAYESLAKGFQVAAQHIIAVPRDEYYRSGSAGAVKSVIKAVPAAVLKPIIATTEALSKALLGVQSQIDPLKSKELEDKYKNSSA